jgi:two-component system, LytTR family, response regulator LytT
VPVPLPRGGTRLIARSTILYVQAYGDYVRIVSDEGRFLMREALADVEERWTPHGFARVHRGYLANLRRATEVRPRESSPAVLVLEDGSEVPIARRQVGDLRRRLRAASS